LFSQTGDNQDIRYSERRTTDARNFCNKIWNASRFVLMNLEGYSGEQPKTLDTFDQWLLSRLAQTEKSVREAYESYNMQAATQALYRFFWSELCDWYIEVSKGGLADKERRPTVQWVLVTCLDAFLKMTHPVMPHITEEVFSHLPGRGKPDFLMSSEWPTVPTEWLDSGEEDKVERWLEAVRTLRALRAELQLTPGVKVAKVYFEGDLAGGEDTIRSQAWAEELVQGRPESGHLSATVQGIDFYLPTEGLVDKDKELARLRKEEEKLESQAEPLRRRLADKNFTERAKPEAVAKATEDLKLLESELVKVRVAIKKLES